MKFKYFLNESGKVALQPKNKVELMKIIKDAIKEQGYSYFKLDSMRKLVKI